MPVQRTSEPFGSSDFVLPVPPSPKPIQRVDSQAIQPPVSMETRPSAYHAFLYLVQFWALGAVAWGVGAILFQLINKAFPETLDRGYAALYLGSVNQYIFKYAIASLIVATPVYFGLSYVITRSVRNGEIPLTSRVRNWVSYIVLFIVTAVMIGDLISLLYFYLGGDLASRTVFKCLTVLGIAGLIFVYYFLDLRPRPEWGTLFRKIFFGLGLSITLIVLVAGFFQIDSPGTTRYKQADEKTVSNIRTVQRYIEDYAAKKGMLPVTLDDLKEKTESNQYGSIEPEYWKELTYNKKTDTAFALCGNFKRSNRDDKKEDEDIFDPAPFLPQRNTEWLHDEGRYCFDRSVTLRNPYDPYGSGSPFGAPQTDFSSSWLQSPVPSMSPTPLRDNTVEAAAYAAQVSATFCRNGGKLVGGKGGAALCEGGSSQLTWPILTECGEANWVVKNSDTDNWDFTLMCPNLPECTGPTNVLCSRGGCSILSSCLNSPYL